MKVLHLMIALLFCFSISGKAQNDIHKVDFKNFTYSNLSCSPNDKTSAITIKDGEFRGNKNGINTFVNITNVKYGDINSDKTDEAIVVYGCGSGASGYYSRALLFTIKNNKPFVLAVIEGGDKGNGGIKEVNIVNNLLVIDRFQLSSGSGSACCPAFIETTKYKLKEKDLIRFGRKTSKKISSSE